jgi:hypothetical protein
MALGLSLETEPPTAELLATALDEAVTCKLLSGIESDMARESLNLDFLDSFAAQFPQMTRTSRRLRAFVDSTD